MSTASTGDKYSEHTNPDAASEAVPSIEIDEFTRYGKFQLPERNNDGGYCDILWLFFYKPGGIGTQAKIIDQDFALVLAQELFPYFQTTAAALARDLQSDVELGQLRLMFYSWINKSKMNKDSDIYQAVKKCDEEIANWGRMVLDEYELAMNGDSAGDMDIARLWADLFLDLYLGEELDLLIDGHGMVNESGQPIRSRLEWWSRLDEQSAKLKIRDIAGAGPNQERCLTVNIARDIISKLRSQGIVLETSTSVFHVKTPTSLTVAETTKRSKRSKRHSVYQIATSSNPNPRKDKGTRRSNSEGKARFKTKPDNNSKKKFESKTDTGGDDGSGSGNDTERIPTPEMKKVVDKIRSEIRRTTPREGAKEVEMDNNGRDNQRQIG